MKRSGVKKGSERASSN